MKEKNITKTLIISTLIPVILILLFPLPRFPKHAVSAGNENEYVVGSYKLEQPDRQAHEIIIRADRVRSPRDSFCYRLHLIEYKDDEVVQEQLLAVNVRFILPTPDVPGDAKALVRFLEPRELRNDKMLAVYDQLWYFTPKARNPVRISRQQRLIGQVSNGDIVAADLHYSYQSTLVGEDWLEEKKCYRLELVRRWDFVTYPKIIYWVAQESYYPMMAEFYSSSDRLMKRAIYKDFKESLGAVRPHEIIIEEGLIRGSYTRMLFSGATFQDLPDAYYQPSYLERIR
ncbi:MAG: outer membrane lipoprotein-sorting protein [Syntrophales bacterium]|jgi:hypothetical protein|nr:outer membrane lipoprotein-sorting protein [Syntrophales bacterium]MCK9527616.1 outer membrane lipoprotein-sorting protein [Syntrophales bacterium]MDX9922233.1 outer membrane lipoprotein-sorting protein [Syntrophales bacterium]